MKIFEEHQIKDAYAYAREGGQSLHLFSSPGVYPGCPECFKRIREAAHLIDYDTDRLISTAHLLGVRVIRVGRRGRRGQHVDLCGKPLMKAKSQVELK